MAKNKKEMPNKQKSKYPFAVLRKGALFALLGTTMFAGGVLAGCDSGSVQGPAGATFYYGTEGPHLEVDEGKVGDFYIETDEGDVWQLKADGWKVLTNIKGPKGDQIDIKVEEGKIKWQYKGEAEWDELISVSSLKGDAGDDSHEVELKIVSEKIQWRYIAKDGENQDDFEWHELIAVAGLKGAQGTEGKSAYEVAKANGFDGNEAEWLEDLKGATGKSAYEIAKDNGYKGTEAEWLEALKGATGKSAYELAIEGMTNPPTLTEWIASLKGQDGKSAYEIAQANGYKGSETEWLQALKGEGGKSAYELATEGMDNPPSLQEWLESLKGKDAVAPVVDINDEGYWTIDGGSTGVKAEGVDGKSAYELAIVGLEGDEIPTLGEWLQSLKGAQGEQGYYVTAIKEVVDDVWGISSHFEFTLNDKDSTKISTESVSRLMPNYYYGANDGDEIIQLIKLGAENIQLEKDINLTSALVIDHNLSIDLNNHKLTYSNDTQVVIDNGIEVEFKDGEMDFIKTKTCVTSSLKVQGGASLILDDVDYISSGTNVMVIENATSVKVKDSHLTGAVYCVGTNASKESHYNVIIEIDDCEFDTTGYKEVPEGETEEVQYFDTTPILINIPCKAIIKDSKITGHRHAVVVRGGDVVIEDCTLINTGKDLNGMGLMYNDLSKTWGDGNKVAMATLVVGNNSTSYQYPTNLDMIDVNIISQRYTVPGVWAQGNLGEGLGTTVNYISSDLDAGFMEGIQIGAGVQIHVAVNTYGQLRSLAMAAEETAGIIQPKLTKDIVAYDDKITVGQHMEVVELREKLTELELLNEFNIYDMFTTSHVCVSQYWELMIAMAPAEYGGLGVEMSVIELMNDIDLSDDYPEEQKYEGKIPLEELLMLDEMNQMIIQNGNKFTLNDLDTNDVVVSTPQGLAAALMDYESESITLLDNIDFADVLDIAEEEPTLENMLIFEEYKESINLNGFTLTCSTFDETNVLVESAEGLAIALKEYANITLVNDITVEHSGFVVENEVTINLNGHIIREMMLETDNVESLFVVNGGTLTIAGEGQINSFGRAIVVEDGEVEINGGEFMNNDTETPLIEAKAGNVTINGGRFNCAEPSNIFSIGTGSITLMGGVFVGYNPSENAGIEIPDGYEVVGDWEYEVIKTEA